MRVEVRERRLRFARPVRTAYGTLQHRDLLELELFAADGASGIGEAAPLEPYDGVSLDSVRAAIDAYRPALQDTDDVDQAQVVAACRAIRDIPQALAAVDLALWDMAGRRAGLPVAQLLSDSPAPSVTVNATIDAGSPSDAAEAAAQAVGDGFRTIKLKVGTPDDPARVAAVRAAAGPETALRLDANGAWTVEEAVAAIGVLAQFDPELVEEPVHGMEGLGEVRERVDVPIAMDETAADTEAAASGATDAVCLKVSACGGVAALLEQAAAARSAGSLVYLASSYDGPVGIAAAIHAAAALAPDFACGLATLDLFTARGPEELRPVAGAIPVPRATGLIDPEAG